jgi:hypothetical protein
MGRPFASDNTTDDALICGIAIWQKDIKMLKLNPNPIRYNVGEVPTGKVIHATVKGQAERVPMPEKAHTFTCDHCKRTKTVYSNITTGHAIGCNGEKVCYYCAARQELKEMHATGKTCLYLSKDADGQDVVTNWPNSLVLRVFGMTKGRHNIAGTRYDVWFFDDEKNLWHGVQYGENTQICHCKRLKHNPYM